MTQMKFFENARVGNNKVSQYVALILASTKCLMEIARRFTK